MSYARFAEGDVYVYQETETKNIVCIQEEEGTTNKWKTHETTTKEEMLTFLNGLKEAGKDTNVAIQRLTESMMATVIE